MTPNERNRVRSDRFDRFLPFAGVLIGLLFLVALVLLLATRTEKMRRAGWTGDEQDDGTHT